MTIGMAREMVAEEIVCEEKRYRLLGVQKEDWDWIKDAMDESFLVSVHPLYSGDLDRVALRRNALLRAGVTWDNDELVQDIILAIDENGERSGMIWMAIMDYQYTGEKRGFILQLYVAPDHRRKGLARSLMRVAERWTLQKGVRTIALHVGASNFAGLELYRSMGYETESVLMNKSLE